MTEPEEVKLRRRRTRQEVQRLVSEFGTSGLARSEFCRIHGMTLNTLQRGFKRERIESGGSQSNDKRLVRVKIIGGSRVFDFRLGREREGPKRFLGNFEGILQSDGYAAYDYVGGARIV